MHVSNSTLNSLTCLDETVLMSRAGRFAAFSLIYTHSDSRGEILCVCWLNCDACAAAAAELRCGSFGLIGQYYRQILPQKLLHVGQVFRLLSST